MREPASRDHWSWGSSQSDCFGVVPLSECHFRGCSPASQSSHRPGVRGFTNSGETLLPLTERFWRVFVDNLCSMLFVCEVVTEKGFWKSRDLALEICEGNARYQRRQGNSSGKCSGRLDSSKCPKPRISCTQRPDLLQKLEKGMSSDANRSMFSSSRFLSSCLPK